LVDAEARGVGVEGDHVFRAEVEVAAGGEVETVAEVALELVAGLADAGIVECPRAAGVRCGDDVGDAVGDGGFGHGEGVFEAAGAVVEARQDVTVQIDHG
jgi:hypothetical protein